MNHEDTKTERVFKELSPEVEHAAQGMVNAAYAVHRALGPGLLESVYETCLVYELTKQGFHVKRQVTLPIRYGDVQLDSGLRIDLLVEDCLVVELKVVEAIQSVHKAQLLTYLKLSGYRLGLLINFNVTLIRDGIKRIIL